uniref:MADF domain-containing protein n=1 Tax=Lepeophtheirus salmonis TaxID=72036 RepID=A0A0K2UB75_LEPSM
MNIPYFIECVKKHPCLWNVNNTNFTDLELKKRAWQDIMEATGEDYMTCTTKWRSLRYTYSRRLRSLIKGEIKTETMWHHFEQLDFLKNFVPMKNFYIPCSSNNPITSTVDYTYHDNKLPSDNESSEKLSGKRKRDSNLEETYENDNEDELFGRIVICKLRKFSERQKSKIRISLLQTFLNIDVENNCE